MGARREMLAEASLLGSASDEAHFDGVLTPGLVNAHTHLQYTGLRTLGAQRFGSVEGWAVAFNEVYRAYEEPPAADPWGEWAADGARMLLSSGQTAAADIVTDDSASGSLHDSGLKGIAFREAMNITNKDWADGAAEHLLAAVERIPHPPAAGISPHTPYSLDEAPLRGIPPLARARGLRMHIHLGEIPMEAEMDDPASIDDYGVRFTTPDFRAMRLAGEGMSATRYLDSLGALGPDCHLAHGIYMNDDDLATLRRHRMAMAFCPRSNTCLGLEDPPVKAYLEQGNPIAIGTDSLTSSPSLALLEEAAVLTRLARGQGYAAGDLYERIFHAATFGGAFALGLHEGTGRIGQIEAGAAADFAVFDTKRAAGNTLSGIQEGGGMPAAEPLFEALASSAPPCLATVIDGEIRFQR
jgi:cytosine/adenosine deaminase-related metal-dependent hydrolase